MRRPVITIAILSAMLLIAGGAAPGDPAGFDERLRSADEALAGVADLRADFEQRKTTPMLRRPLVSRGGVACKGQRILWTTEAPHASVMLVAPDSVTIYFPEDNLAEVYPADARFADAAGGPLPRLEALRDRFDIAPASPEDLERLADHPPDPRRDLVAVLTPRDEEMKRHVARVLVVLDTSVPCARRVVITDPDGDTTDIRFTNIRTNTGLKDDDIRLRLPSGVRTTHPAGKPPSPESPSLP